MQRYFAKEIKEEKVILQDSDLHHIQKVMRMEKGDKIEVIYNRINYLCAIKSIIPLELEILESKLENNELEKEIILAPALIKEQKQDFLLQKLTELGVSKIIPLALERSVVKIEEKKKDKKIERWNNILKEASEQSHRTTIPVLMSVSKITDLEKLLDENTKTLKIVLSVNEKTKTLKNTLQKLDDYDRIIIVVGPEGGISPKEESYLMEHGYERVSLGPRILRAETASIYITSIMNYCCMR